MGVDVVWWSNFVDPLVDKASVFVKILFRGDLLMWHLFFANNYSLKTCSCGICFRIGFILWRHANMASFFPRRLYSTKSCWHDISIPKEFIQPSHDHVAAVLGKRFLSEMLMWHLSWRRIFSRRHADVASVIVENSLDDITLADL